MRLTSGPRYLNSRYVRISAGYPELDALIDDAENMPVAMYYDEFLYAQGTYASPHVNITDYYSARLTPDSAPMNGAKQIVWTFGGSTMENTETTDALTIANTWARSFNDSIGPTHVKNFGTDSFFSSYELIKFQRLLREVPPGELPTIAIFYDGYNDTVFGFQYGPGSMQKDLSLKMEALVEHDDLRIAIYALSRRLDKHSILWQRTGARLAEYLLFPLPEPDPSDANLDAAIRVYTSNVAMIQATCKAFEVQCFFLLQPLVLTKQPLSEEEQQLIYGLDAHPRFGTEGIQFVRAFYESVARELADDEHSIDASAVLDGRTQADFYDVGHVGALTPPVIGEATASLILERLHEAGR